MVKVFTSVDELKREIKLRQKRLQKKEIRLSIFNQLVVQVTSELLELQDEIKSEEYSTLEETMNNFSIIANLVDEVKLPCGTQTSTTIDAMRQQLETQQKEYERDETKQRDLDRCIFNKGLKILDLEREINKLGRQSEDMDKEKKSQRGPQTDFLVQSAIKSKANDSKPKKKVTFHHDVIFEKQSPSHLIRRVTICSCFHKMAKKVDKEVARQRENKKNNVDGVITDFINAMADTVIKVCKDNGQVQRLANAKNHINEVIAAKLQSELDKSSSLISDEQPLETEILAGPSQPQPSASDRPS